jgi:manganese/zinc/iron transport system ATP- binding protein
MNNQIVDIHNLTVSYQHKPVLWNIDVNIPQGALVGIVGPNGAGKSTLIKSIMGLTPISSGKITLMDKELKDVRQKISYVPQRESVDWDFPASVLDVVLMGRFQQTRWFGKYRQADKERALACIRKVNLEEFTNRQISQLSGGQQQRVFIARALAQDADIYFMDEPFAGVDAASEKMIIELLKEMSAQGKTIIVVHHDLNAVKNYFNYLLLLNTRLIAYGPTSEVFTEENIQKTYGSKLTILSSLANEIQQNQFPH